MTEQEANALVDDFSFVYNGKSISKEALIECREVIHKALEKQIPKKPKKLTYKLLIDSGWEYECPNCGLAIGKNKYTDYEYIEEYEEYCQNCGQALDWSD